jgi:hypothetical protein
MTMTLMLHLLFAGMRAPPALASRILALLYVERDYAKSTNQNIFCALG